MVGAIYALCLSKQPLDLRVGDVNEKDVRRWVDGYVTAWNSNAEADIVALFTEDAKYYTEPHAKPWSGHETIVTEWLGAKDEPGETTFEYRVIAIDRDLAIVKGQTTYRDPPKTYSNLWEIRLTPDRRAYEFVEWWMEQ